MKKLIFISVIVLLNTLLFAQSPSAFKYQAVVRDASGASICNSDVSLKFIIHQGSPTGAAVYDETHTPTTNDFGLVNLEIGNGTPVSGNFSTIEWESDIYFITVALDITGGTNYQDMGTEQLFSVPYAMHTTTAEDAVDAEKLNGQNPAYYLNWNNLNNIPPDIADGDDVDDADNDPANECQQLSINGNTLYISPCGNSVTLPSGTSLWSQSGNDIYYNSGNVGIGTSNPYGIFEVYNTSNVEEYVTTGSATGSARTWYSAGSVGFGNSWNVGIRGDMNKGYAIESYSGGWAPRLFITQAGNVGINTSNPQELLNVAGGTIEVYPATDGTRGIRVRSADQSENFILDMKNDGTMQIGSNSGVMQLASTFGVQSRNLSGTWRSMSASSFDVQSSRNLKTNIKYIEQSGTEYWLDQILLMKPANYIYNWETESTQPRLGFIVEELPEELKGQDGKSVNLYALTSAGIAGIKGLYLMLEKQQELIKSLQEEIEALKNKEDNHKTN